MNAFRSATGSMMRSTTGRRLSSANANPSYIPKQYYDTKMKSFDENVGKAAFNINDPRTFPRVAVWATTASLFAYFTYKTYTYRSHHFNERRNVINQGMAERPVDVTKRVFEKAPIVLNAKKYHTLRHEGLGVDHDEWLKSKTADYTNPSKEGVSE